MSAAVLLDRLEGVQARGHGWRAVCPACSGKSRKLSVSEADEGRVLVHCFSGCSASEVVQAVGLTLQDLFPERLAADTPEERKRRQRAARETQWGAALDVITYESTLVEIAARQIASDQPLSPADRERLQLAITRLTAAQMVLRDKPKWQPVRVAA